MTLTADKIIIATGTVPGRPAGIQFDDRRIVDSDGLLKLTEIPRTMTFVGAGVVGVEYATIFQVLGVRVTLIDARERPLDFVDNEIEDALYYNMRDEGITLRFGERVSRVVPSEDNNMLGGTKDSATMPVPKGTEIKDDDVSDAAETAANGAIKSATAVFTTVAKEP